MSDDNIVNLTPSGEGTVVPKPDGGLLGPDGEPINKPAPTLDNKVMPSNDEGLCAVEIIGRCSKCSITGTIEYPGGKIPTSQVDRLLNYKPVKCFCMKCRAYTEFLPIAYKKYPDVPMLGNLQKGYKGGLVK